MFSRLHRLEARAETGAGPKRSERARELEAFNRAAEQYIRAAREYLHEPAEGEMSVPCGNERKMLQVVNQLTGYYLRGLRQGAREGLNRSLFCGEAQESSGETRSALSSPRQ